MDSTPEATGPDFDEEDNNAYEDVPEADGILQYEHEGNISDCEVDDFEDKDAPLFYDFGDVVDSYNDEHDLSLMDPLELEEIKLIHQDGQFSKPRQTANARRIPKKHKRNIWFKIQVVDYYHRNPNHSAVARKFGVHHSQISQWAYDYDDLMAAPDKSKFPLHKGCPPAAKEHEVLILDDILMARSLSRKVSIDNVLSSFSEAEPPVGVAFQTKLFVDDVKAVMQQTHMSGV
ncbi:hypothetical protein HDU98_006927 [Podochytrium sp. JEL0797]|nr:hypothetical protein HDU98_006927 [Podochytrium sp. JEL0797]